MVCKYQDNTSGCVCICNWCELQPADLDIKTSSATMKKSSGHSHLTQVKIFSSCIERLQTVENPYTIATKVISRQEKGSRAAHLWHQSVELVKAAP